VKVGVAGNSPLDAAMCQWTRLASQLRATIAPSAWRACEHAIRARGRRRTFSSTACLRRRLKQEELAALLPKTRLSNTQRNEVQGFHGVPCWRHIVRIDSDGGFDLYSERDYDRRVLRSLCQWVGTDSRQASVASALSKHSDFVVAIAAVGWSRKRGRRLRFHLVTEPSATMWTSTVKSVWRVMHRYDNVRVSQEQFVRALADRRRALLLNVEWRNATVAFKLEIPDVRFDRAGELCKLLGAPPPDSALGALGLSRMRYLGIRWEQGIPLETTAYVPCSWRCP